MRCVANDESCGSCKWFVVVKDGLQPSMHSGSQCGVSADCLSEGARNAARRDWPHN